MLSALNRLTDAASFRSTTRAGRRASSATVVTHLAPPSGAGQRPVDAATRVGFVVGKSVGNSVVRHRVQRRLRHLVRERLDLLPASSSLVVRALPASASATSSQLAADLDSCLRRSAVTR